MNIKMTQLRRRCDPWTRGSSFRNCGSYQQAVPSPECFFRKKTRPFREAGSWLLKEEIDEPIGEKSHFETGIKLATITATNSYQYSFTRTGSAGKWLRWR